MYLDRLQCQEELVKLINSSMNGAETVTFAGFKKMSEEVSSSIYLCVCLPFR